MKVKVWERGAGLTKACGTAACATTVAGAVLNLLERSSKYRIYRRIAKYQLENL